MSAPTAQVLGLGLRGPAARARRGRAGRGRRSRAPRLRPADVERPVRARGRASCRRRASSRPPRSAAICRSDPYERAAHAYGKAYRDVVRAFRGRFDHPPDVVAHPRDEGELERCSTGAPARRRGDPVRRRHERGRRRRAAVADGYAGAVTIDLKALDRVLEVDAVSRAARIQAGATGPGLEEQLREHGLTLRHYPQSFEYSTLGGWIATRAGGHFATLAHAHRRLRGVGARDHPARRVGEPAAARLGRRAEPRPHADRLGGHPRRDHRGLGAGAGGARASGRPPACCSTASRTAPGGAGARPVAASTRPTAACSTRRGGAHRRRARRAGRCWCSASSRPTTRSTRGMARALELCRDHGGEPQRASDGRVRGRLARRLPAGALPARHAGRRRHPGRDLRDRDHLGPLRRRSSPRCASAHGAALGPRAA